MQKQAYFFEKGTLFFEKTNKFASYQTKIRRSS